MSAAPRPSSRSERTRSAILEAAEAHFSAAGFDGTRLEDVAESVGIRRASIVYYFRDKRELYEAVLAEVFGDLLGRIEDALLAPGPLALRIERAVGAWVDCAGARPGLPRLLLREVADATRGEATLRRHTEPFFRLVERVLAETRDDPLHARHIDPAHLTSAIAGTSVFHLAAMPFLVPELSREDGAAARLERHRQELLQIVRRVLGAPESGGSAPAADAGTRPAAAAGTPPEEHRP